MTIIIHVHVHRFLRACSQTFNIIKTPSQHIIIILGSTGNAYFISIKSTSLTCNCPDKNAGCKHILFLLNVLGYFKNQKYQPMLSIYPKCILKQLSQAPTQQLQGCFLDPRTINLCSAHTYPMCFFCAKKHSGSIIICSECGYLAHKSCYNKYIHSNSDNFDHNYCPKCGQIFTPLDSTYFSGYRNYYFVLKFRGYRTDLITDLPPSDLDNHYLRQSNSNPQEFQSVIRDI